MSQSSGRCGTLTADLVALSWSFAMKRFLTSVALVLACGSANFLFAAEALPVIKGGIEAQPFKAQAKRIADALEIVGEPLKKDEKAALDKALAIEDETEAVVAIQKVLDARCLAGVNINPESRVKVAR